MKPVTVGDVLSCAKGKCKSCHGTGVLRVWDFVNENTQTRTERVCGCARRRFLKKNADKVDTKQEPWSWKEEVAA